MKDKDCIFCLLANGDIPTAKVYEDDDLTVILDAGPATKAMFYNGRINGGT